MCSVINKSTPRFFSSSEKQEKDDKIIIDRRVPILILLLRSTSTTQNYNSDFPFISFYFAPDQKRTTFACNGAHTGIYNKHNIYDT